MYFNVYMYEYICNIYISELVLWVGGIYFILKKKLIVYFIYEFDFLINDY